MKHIAVYDYNAALDVALTIKSLVGDRLVTLLSAAAARVRMEQSTVDRILRVRALNLHLFRQITDRCLKPSYGSKSRKNAVSTSILSAELLLL